MEIVVTALVATRLTNPLDNLNLMVDDFDFYALPTTRQAYAEFLVPSLYVPLHVDAKNWAQNPRLRRCISDAGEGRVTYGYLGLDRVNCICGLRLFYIRSIHPRPMKWAYRSLSKCI